MNAKMELRIKQMNELTQKYMCDITEPKGVCYAKKEGCENTCLIRIWDEKFPIKSRV